MQHNSYVNIERFLHYWNSHDTLIIQSLVGCILLMVIYLAIRMFFGSEAGGISPDSGKSVNSLTPNMTNEIEKSLQKILDNQVKGTSASPMPSTVSTAGAQAAFNASPLSPKDNAGAAVSVATEVPLLKAEIQARDEKLKTLEAQLSQVKSASAQATSDTGLASKVKDLQSRLTEYEIISEDIADLSFYKEENARMQNELTVLKGGKVAAQPQQPTPVAPAMAAEPAPIPAPSAGDEDLMKQFAQAVEEQKIATAEGDAPVQKAQVDTELMGKFEEFVKKN